MRAAAKAGGKTVQGRIPPGRSPCSLSSIHGKFGQLQIPILVEVNLGSDSDRGWETELKVDSALWISRVSAAHERGRRTIALWRQFPLTSGSGAEA